MSTATSTPTTKTKIHAGIRDLAPLYDVFLIDQWGVMHDGHTPYPGAVECMANLQQMGKKIILLSNSSKRKAGSFARLRAMGFTPDAYVDVVTSGELTHAGLTQPRDTHPYNEIKGEKVLVFGSGDDDEDYVKELGCEIACVETADFLLARGPFAILSRGGGGNGEGAGLCIEKFGPKRILHESAEFAALATRAIARGVPMIVSNPDVVRPGGDQDPMPGMLGAKYESLGGTVHYVGKPFPLVYSHCRSLLTPTHPHTHTPTLKLCAIGDSMYNDIKGAANEDFASIFVCDGIHAQALGVKEGEGEEVEEEALEAFLEGFDWRPTHSVERFRW